MRLCSRYISKKITTNLIISLSILVGLIWFSRAIGFIKFVTENGVKLNDFLNLFLLILPWILLFIIPISLLSSILITFNQLITNNELTILKNSGLQKLQISRPTFKIAIISTLICYVISFYIMPYATREMNKMKNIISANYSTISFTPKTFENLSDLTVYIKNRDQDNNLYGILIYDKRPEEYSLSITAAKGYISTEENSALLYLEKGTIQKFHHKEIRSEILNFDNYTFNLSDNSNERKSKKIKPKELNFFQLLAIDEKNTQFDQSEIKTEIHKRLTYPLLSINLAIISLAFILRGNFNRRGNAKNIILAIFVSATYVGIISSLYSLTESSSEIILVTYLTMILFFMIHLKMLKKN